MRDFRRFVATSCSLEPLEPRIAPAGVASINVTALNGSNGLRIDGTGAEHFAGTSVDGVGDVNGDGFDDFIFSELVPPEQNSEGRALVVFGKATGFPAILNPATLDGSNGFKISGLEARGTFVTPGVGSAGDVNNDGIDDILVSGGGTAYVIFGKATGFGADVSVLSLNGANGFAFGKAGGTFHEEAAAAGDVNGDSFGDLIFTRDNEAFVLFGKANGIAPFVDVTTLSGGDGFAIDLADESGFLPLRDVAGAGDINGDGIDDLVIGAMLASNSSTPEAYLLFGHTGPFSASISTSSLNGSNGFRLEGDLLISPGFIVGSAHDINGDGIDDLITSNVVVFGHSNPFPPSLSVRALDGQNGFRIAPPGSIDRSVAGAGDFNADGYGDLLINNPGNDAAAVLFGKASSFSADVDVSALDGSNGLTIVLPPSSTEGTPRRTIGGAGDLNGDGIDDIIVGARSADTNGTNSGAAYVIFGIPPSLSISDASVLEGFQGTTPATFTISLSASLDHPVSVFVSSADGTATAGEDYDALTLTQVTFAPGETTKSVQVAIRGDRTFEPDETFAVNLSNASGAPINDAQGVGTIRLDDIRPSIIITGNAGNSLAEPAQGDALAGLRVSLTNPSSETITVTAQTFDGSAVAPDDYSPLAGAVVTFAPGEIDKIISVSVHADAIFEADETFSVILSNPINASIAAGSAQITIRNVQPPPAISISDIEVLEGDASTVAASFTVTLSSASSSAVSVSYATADGTATAPGDYAALPLATLTFAPGEVSKQVTVEVAGDSMPEGDEIFFVNLSNPTGGTIADAQGRGRIVNDDAFPGITINDVSVIEGTNGTASASFAVVLSAQSTQTVSVRYATGDGTATAPADYAALPLSTLTFAPGETSKTITVDVQGDAMFEADETLFVNLSDPLNAIVLDPQGQGTIANDDSSPTVRISDASKAEGDAGLAGAVFDVTLSNPSSQVVSVRYATADGSAIAPEDYVAVALSTLTFAPGEVSKSISINLKGDTVFEFDEEFSVDLSDPTNVTIGDEQGQGTIANDDPLPAISIANVSVMEGANGTTAASFIVSLSRQSSQPVSLQYATSDGSAVAPGDYTALPLSTLTFAPFETSKIVVVNIHGDAVFEPNETFFVDLSNPTGATLADPQGQGTILNDEPVPAVAIDDVIIVEGDAGSSMATFTVGLSGASSEAVSVQYATADGTAASPDDYAAVAPTTLIFTPGETSKTLSIEVKGDAVFELDETFFVNLIDPANASLADPQGRATIINDEPLPAISIDDVRLLEGAGGTTTASFAVRLSRASSQAVSVQYATADGTATGASDYVPLALSTLSFSPLETSKTVAVEVKGDAVFEADEAFFLELSNANNATLGDAQGDGTILNDEVIPVLRIDDATVVEGAEGSSLASFTVTLSGESSQAVSVQYATTDGTAAAPEDYTALALSTLAFEPGETSKTIGVAVKGDGLHELDETFFVDLSNATGAVLGDTQGEATIVNDDVVVTIFADGRKARFSDNDDDLVTVKTSRGGFVPENFVFSSDGTLQALDLKAPETLVSFSGAKISVFAKTPVTGGGDGFVSVGALEAQGMNLKSVKIDGPLGQIDVGEGTAGKAALKSLVVQSLGVLAASGEESTIAGNLGTFKTKGDFTGVLYVVAGAPPGDDTNVRGIALTKVVVGGNIDGSSGGTRAGLIEVAGGIGSVLVKGSITGGAELSGIVAGGSIGAITIEGNLISADGDKPVTISVLGVIGARTVAQAVALGALAVGGGVLHAQVLAGFARDLTPLNPLASIGSIDVAGSWNASSAVAGVADVTGDGFGRHDAAIAGSPLPGLLSRIARITIHGVVAGSSASGDFFGITAQQIGRIAAGSIRPQFTPGPNDFLLDPLNNDFRVVDFA